MNRKNRGLLIGTLLGDSSIHKTISNCMFQFTHQIKQEDYAFYKAGLLFNMFGGKPKTPKLYKSKTAYGEVEYYKFCFSNKYFNFLHRLIYSNNGKKYFSERILNYLTPHGIALWYMDDGGVSRTKSKFSDHIGVEMRISTYCSLEEIENIINYFNKVWGITAKKRYSKKTNSYYLAFSTKESEKFEKLISKFILPKFRYKLPSSYITRVQDTPSG